MPFLTSKSSEEISCLSKVSDDVRDGINWCLGFNLFCVISSDENLQQCRSCLWRAYNYGEIEKAFTAKQLHPLDLKNAVAREINALLQPLQKQKDKLEKAAKLGYE